MRKISTIEDSVSMGLRLTAAATRNESVCATLSPRDTADRCSRISKPEPDAVVADIQSCDGNGLAVVKQTKYERPAIKAVVLSNAVISEYRHGALMTGVEKLRDTSTAVALRTTIFSDQLLGFQSFHKLSLHHAA